MVASPANPIEDVLTCGKSKNYVKSAECLQVMLLKTTS